jgi:hypothetical protein
VSTPEPDPKKQNHSTKSAVVASLYLYATAALDGPARWITSKRLKPTSRHHFSKSAAEWEKAERRRKIYFGSLMGREITEDFRKRPTLNIQHQKSGMSAL